MIHFVYSYPTPTYSKKIRFHSAIQLQKKGLSVSAVGKRQSVALKDFPETAPSSISKCLLEFLRKDFSNEVLFYDWKERLQIPGGNNDILFGHPNFLIDDAVWNRSCLNGNFKRRIAILPLSHHSAETYAHLDPMMSKVDLLFAITGPYWFDTWEQSALAPWKEKMIRLDMAIDISKFPRVKKRFNPPGKRKFFYIGNSHPAKGTHLLELLFGRTQGKHSCVAIGPPPLIRNLDHRPAAKFNLPYMQKLGDECDFLIHLGISDANPTTILESMAWGFPVSSTPQSGYWKIPEINSELSTTDMEKNREVLDRLQFAKEEELLDWADRARVLVEKNYTWDKFLNTISFGFKTLSQNSDLLFSERNRPNLRNLA